MKTYSVSEVNNIIKDTINELDKISIRGEISNKKISGGHIYLSIKDNNSMISGIIWKSTFANMNIELNNGDEIIASGKINIFTRNGSYSLHISSLEKCNKKGDIFTQYSKLKEKYNKLGYFDEKLKKKLPKNINTIGIVTSAGGAALQDILYVIKNNNVNVNIIIKNCQVQGETCYKSIYKSIREISKMDIDVIIVGRGGGSIEDLMGFSHKKVIEEIYKCQIPVISAVGHEVDFMLSDFVADIRAPTPSVAGEIISKVYNEYKDNLLRLKESNINSLKNIIIDYNLKIQSLKNKIKDPTESLIYKIKSIKQSNDHLFHTKISEYNNKLFLLKEKLNIYVMNKSNEICLSTKSDKIIISKDDLINEINNNQKEFKLLFADGEINIIINLKK
jgi:exodeoxyribonuclease VII large subunit